MAETVSKAIGSGIQHIKYRVATTDLVIANTARTIAISKLPDDAVVLACFADLKTAFTSGTITNVTVKLGTSADDDGFLAATELLAGPAATGRKDVNGAWTTGDGATVNAIFTATGANFGDGSTSALTAGAVDLHILYVVAK